MVGERFDRFKQRHDAELTRHASGLFVPAAVARRVVKLTKDDWRAIDRGLTAAARVEVLVAFKCKAADCGEPVKRLVNEHGQTVFRCGCTDRVLERAF